MKIKLMNGKSYTVSLITKTSENDLCIGNYRNTKL